MSETRLAKPNLRNFHLTRAKRNLPIVLGVSVLTGIVYKVLISDPFDRKMSDFYKTYDPAVALKKMNAAGLMQSHPTD
ncbi:cytochrome c oxidase subunit cyclope [Colletes latitarsis]|uniref:cytochrome c oxidase subunit cyclope n=1 Tax=Colletes latitarsis TaxID=2605962 RepID=UPI004035485D